MTYLVGESRIGPFSAANAANGIVAAIQAERMLVSHRRALEKEQERQVSMDKDSFWQRLFN